MPVLCRPAVAVPEHVITQEETLDLARTLHADHASLPLVLRLIRNTGVARRHLVQPIEQTLAHPGFEARNTRYEAEAKARVPAVVAEALGHAGLAPRDIDLIVHVSCTGFMMPSLTAWMINNLGFRSDTRQLPIAQLGCAAGGAAINRAHDFCLAYPGANALVVACEFCSLCYQPTDLTIGNLLSNGLFGDAVAAAVVRSSGSTEATGVTGIRLERNGSHLVPDTEDWIAYRVRETGFHFMLDKRVPGTMEQLAPALVDLAARHGRDAGLQDFYLVHAGGPRILDDLGKHLDVPADAFRFSRATLTEYGNIASAVVLDALRRLFEEGGPAPGATGILAGFGPGITAEISLGSWTAPRPGDARSAAGAEAALARLAAGSSALRVAGAHDDLPSYVAGAGAGTGAGGAPVPHAAVAHHASVPPAARASGDSAAPAVVTPSTPVLPAPGALGDPEPPAAGAPGTPVGRPAGTGTGTGVLDPATPVPSSPDHGIPLPTTPAVAR